MRKDLKGNRELLVSQGIVDLRASWEIMVSPAQTGPEVTKDPSGTMVAPEMSAPLAKLELKEMKGQLVLPVTKAPRAQMEFQEFRGLADPQGQLENLGSRVLQDLRA